MTSTVSLIQLLVAGLAGIGAWLIFPHTPAGLRALPAMLTPRRIDRGFAAVVWLALLGSVAYSLHSYTTFGSFRDFVDYDTSLLHLLSGGSIETMVNFGRRFNPIMLALVPLYAVWRDPRILLVLQSVGLVAAVLPLYWFARRRLGHALAFVIALTYLMFPAVQAINRPVLYEIKLAIPLFAFATFFLLRKRYLPFLACLAVALLLKQEVAFTALGFAAYIFFAQRQRGLGLGIAASASALAIFVIQFLYPWLSHGQAYPQFDERYAYLGHSLSAVLTTLFTQPQVVLQHILIPPKLDFIANLLVPLALTPLLGADILLISLPAWTYTLLSDLPQQFDLNQYYQAPLLPFLFFATVVGLRRLIDGRSSRAARSTATSRRKFALALLLAVSAQLYLPSVWARVIDPSNFMLDPHTRLGYQLMQQIPAGATVAAQSEFYIPLTTTRRYTVQEFAPHVDYRSTDYLFGDTTRFWYDYHRATWEHWRASGYFELVAAQDGYFLLKRQAIDRARQTDTGWAVLGLLDAPNPLLQSSKITYGGDLTLLGYALVPDRSLSGGDTLRLILEWQAVRKIDERYTMLAQLVDEQGHLWAEDDHAPLDGSLPTDRLKAGDLLRDEYVLALPRTMPPGIFQLTIGLWNQRGGVSLAAQDAQGMPLGIRPPIEHVQVARNSAPFPASYLAIEQPLNVAMREAQLLGLTSLPRQIAPGDQLEIGVYWLAKTKPSGDYAVTAQLLDAQGKVVAEQTSRPAAGAYPTTLWQPGEILLDWHDLTVPPNFSSARYQLKVILRDAITQKEIGNVTVDAAK